VTRTTNVPKRKGSCTTRTDVAAPSIRCVKKPWCAATLNTRSITGLNGSPLSNYTSTETAIHAVTKSLTADSCELLNSGFCLNAAQSSRKIERGNDRLWSRHAGASTCAGRRNRSTKCLHRVECGLKHRLLTLLAAVRLPAERVTCRLMRFWYNKCESRQSACRIRFHHCE
jgi:hypothetical protein